MPPTCTDFLAGDFSLFDADAFVLLLSAVLPLSLTIMSRAEDYQSEE